MMDVKGRADLRRTHELAKDVAAFANHLGGTVLYGAIEKDGLLERYEALDEAGAREHKDAIVPAREMMEEMIGPLSFGRFLRVWREFQEMSQVDAAAKLGVTKARLSDLEHGRRLASVELARAIAKKLGAPETQAMECCLQDQLRKAKVTKLRVKLVA